ncbi:hypothetical protein B0T17DRAFT_507023 [Bombardia bombarda]|uniref:RRM domain-containing protein n=1 Tax=Bombardia bombarda TaxID=252184 RepID=A0AA40CAT0_9PEZI|nr:hypothetical protein B0T17DRAFT_507023 [Bombardia bombarda]
MAPKKKEVQKLSLAEFVNDSSFGGGSWADEVEDTYGTQPMPLSERRTGATSYGGGDRGYHTIRDNLPQSLPDKPPYTAHLGNLSYDATSETVTEFFEGCNIVSVRIIEDREQNRPKGFAYAEFGDLDGLKQALTLDGEQFQGRSIRVKIADPPKAGDRGESTRDFSDWSRKGPLADLPGRGGDRGGERRGGAEFGERRAPREPQADDGKVRDFGNWERRGPLSPAAQPERTEGFRDGSRSLTTEGRSESFRTERRASPAAWGPGEPRPEGTEGSRPPRREFAADRPERVASAAEKDFQWRTSMRPDAAAKTGGESREGSEAPSSPSAHHATLAGRPKLNLIKRTVSEAPAVTSPAASTDAKASPFGAARPIDTAAKEREIEEKRLQAIKDKKEADEKAKEERRLAKEAAIKEAAEKAEKDKEAAEKAEEAEKAEAAEKAEKAAKAEAEAAEKAAAASDEAAAASAAAPAAAPAAEAKAAPQEGATPATDASTTQKAPARTREPREPRVPKEDVANPKTRAAESGNWRRGGGEQRESSRGAHAGGPRRGPGAPRPPRSDSGRLPRANGSGPAAAPTAGAEEGAPAPKKEDDGWTTVPNKARRGQSNRPLA